MRILIGLLAVIWLAACATTGSSVATRTAEQLVPEYTFRLNERMSASVGEPMTASSPLMLAKVLVFEKALSSTTSHRGNSLLVEAPEGNYVVRAQDSEGYFYEPGSGQVIVNGDAHPGGIFMPHDDSGRAGLFWRWKHSISEMLPLEVYMAYLPSVPEPDSESNTVLMPPGFYDGLVSTLSYVGMSGEEIRFVYREYYDRKARAAFTQQIEFDYSPGTAYSYKSAKFVVHEADSLGVSYTLQSPL